MIFLISFVWHGFALMFSIWSLTARRHLHQFLGVTVITEEMYNVVLSILVLASRACLHQRWHPVLNIHLEIINASMKCGFDVYSNIKTMNGVPASPILFCADVQSLIRLYSSCVVWFVPVYSPSHFVCFCKYLKWNNNFHAVVDWILTFINLFSTHIIITAYAVLTVLWIVAQ